MISKISTLETVKQAFFRKRDILTNELVIDYFYQYTIINNKNFVLFEFLKTNTETNKTHQEKKLCNQIYKYIYRYSNNYKESLYYTCSISEIKDWSDMKAICNRKDDFIEINQNQNQNQNQN
jgi:hypothetical protein